MPDPTWFIDEHGARRFKTRRAAARHPEWREEKTSSADAESEPAEQADADKTARKGTTKRS
jgi:hypothetical protein